MLYPMNKKTLWLPAIILLLPFVTTFVLSAESMVQAYVSGNRDLLRLWLCIYASQPLTLALLYLLVRGAAKIVKKIYR